MKWNENQDGYLMKSEHFALFFLFSHLQMFIYCQKVIF